MAKKTLACPCGSGRNYSACCEAYVKRLGKAPTAELLMRSRYTAYVLNDEKYLLATWHESTRPDALHLAETPPTKWLGLEIVSTQEGSMQDNEGVVEFVARYKVNGKAERLHEISYFIKENEQWFYVNGELL